ncbi:MULTISPECIES: long-chain fatty acid--CoA ligase [unclassified Herbaspirillum]|uniref:long-chain fatty acid--CoA ligase n=1 Tax=unclassified Herbaspirillum TaxID=2624150 RepID=UPI0011520DA5|nr:MULTISPECIES: long-chain fatty acid--CoA ligase [unclassified Herbaspirillum]MBB5391642.1 long-chain acyl-CoA synthetase [Herbaspirillum sp. SJZ102]TQK12677.1 long-chain acyl-CoA synthetase [Herbaspirillum sp. SJZ130]TQK14681.1 long-chain acyl-CoA synthetase [Herbaspirillum sp. SJZ106]TWC62767.1 long-chain acyl-CoA synthetase [Herbaspirillum sp. SJZ099]
MEKFWLASYPAGVPAEIDPGRYGSLVQMIDEAFAKYADRNAYVCMGKYLSYAELDRLSRLLGAWLQGLGLEKGARVAIMMPNVLQYPIAIAAILRAGYTVVNVNPLYTARELEHQLKDSGAEAIFVLENFACTLQKVLEKTRVKHIVVASMGELLGTLKGAIVNLVVRHVKKMVPAWSLPHAITFSQALQQAAGKQLRPVALGHEDIAFLQYTGGTTGVAKGAVLTHRNLVANVLQAEEWLNPALKSGKPIDQLVFVCALPLYHIFALTVCNMLGTREGALNLLIPNPRDIPGFVKELAKYKVNTFPAVNTLYNALLNNAEFAKLDFSGYRCCVGGGMAVQKSVADKWKKLTGCPIIEGYGLSETSPIASANPCTIDEYTGTIGLPLPATDIAILDDNGKPVALGQPGEIAIRGPQVMAGYWQRPDETAKVMTDDGFFKTGDIGVMDERGYTRIVDRKKDMILVSGFNVYPNEIEGVVALHPGVLECACVGVPDEHTGEAVKLFVVRKDKSLTAEQLMAYCKEQFTGYKKPKYIEFRDELPKTNVGKILRRELRDEQKKAQEEKKAA